MLNEKEVEIWKFIKKCIGSKKVIEQYNLFLIIRNHGLIKRTAYIAKYLKTLENHGLITITPNFMVIINSGVVK